MSRNQETTLTLSGALNGTLRGDLSCNGLPTSLVRRDDGILPGTPMPLPGSRLPANHCWADRSLILFADWPDLKTVYDAGLLDVLPADATEQEKSAQPRKWVLNANADGLLLPDIGGCFTREWRPDQSHDAGREAGTRQGDAIRNITGQAYLCSGAGDTYGGVIFSAEKCFNVESVVGAHNGSQEASLLAKRYSYLNFDASGVVPTAEENRPLNDAQPVAIYMGRNAADITPEPPLAPAAALRLLARYDTAGDFSWTVPDLYGGQSYPVYVRMKGAGAGGSSAGRSGVNYSGNGGGEGCLVEFDLAVTPGETHSLTVGLGGAGGILTPDSGYSGNISHIAGQAGGRTLFGDVSTAPGASTQRGAYKAYPEGRTEILTPGASGGSKVNARATTVTMPGAHGGGQGGGTAGGQGMLGGGGGGGSCQYAASNEGVIFMPGGKGGDGFIEIYTR